MPQTGEEPKLDQDHTLSDQAIRTLILARRKGATVRSLAQLFGCSKSTMGRLVQSLDALSEDALSHLGRRADENPTECLGRRVPNGTRRRAVVE
jgi:hypothetical protein